MALTLDRTEQLFPLPLWRFRVEELDLNSLLLAEIAERRASEPGQDADNRVGWQSRHDLFSRPEPGHRRLARIAFEAMNKAVVATAIGPGKVPFDTVLNGWINVNPPGGYNTPHTHQRAYLSGVYYIDVPEGASPKGGAIEFLSPHPVRPFETMIESDLCRDKLVINPEPGELIVFPSQISHWVHPNDSGRERVTAAFNAALRPQRQGVRAA